MNKRNPTPCAEIVNFKELPFEPPKTVEKLRDFLQAALQVEHLTIPPYLTAMYTLRPGTNPAAFFTTRSVVLEEMLHMTLVANLLNAVGGTPCVAHPQFVLKYPAELPFNAEKTRIPLQHFSPQALKTFLLIERPQSMSPPPNGKGWTSIGQFYDYIRQGLEFLVKKHTEKEVFKNAPRNQVGPEDFYNSGGEVFAVTDRKSALLALRVISEQGEGLGNSIWSSDDRIFGEERQVAHYFRFKEISTGRCYGPHDTPKDEPSGPPMDVTWDDAYKIDGSSTVAEYKKFPNQAVHHRAVAFNRCYANMLAFLQKAFTGDPRSMSHAVPTMLELRDRAQALYRNPHPDPKKAEQGYFASATFEIDQPTVNQGIQYATARIEAAGLSPDEPVDLSALTAPIPL